MSLSPVQVSFPETTGEYHLGESEYQTVKPAPLKTTGTARDASESGGVMGLMKDLDRLQEQQVTYSHKIEMEKKRKAEVDQALENAKEELRSYQATTKSGSIVKDEEIIKKKMIGKLEHALQKTRVKYSVLHRDNGVMKRKIDEMRQEKIMHLTILSELERELVESRERAKYTQKEITVVNDRKHRLEVEITNLKHKMFRDMEVFSSELGAAKRDISNTQANILGSIRERLQGAFDTANFDDFSEFDERSAAALENERSHSASAKQSELAVLLSEVGVDSLEDLIVTLQQAEEKMFVKYHEIQGKNEEMETLELENKHLEAQMEAQLIQLESLETHNDRVKHELEQQINTIQRSIAKYDAEYAQNVEMLSSSTEICFSILKNVAIDEEGIDQKLLMTGVNERNIPDFLGLLEQRIDELIQMMKAANHQNIRREDFGRTISRAKEGAMHAPVLPSLADDDNDADDDKDDNTKTAPINISMLKDAMKKKVQRGINKKEAELAKKEEDKSSSRQGGAAATNTNTSPSQTATAAATTTTTTAHHTPHPPVTAASSSSSMSSASSPNVSKRDASSSGSPQVPSPNSSPFPIDDPSAKKYQKRASVNSRERAEEMRAASPLATTPRK